MANLVVVDDLEAWTADLPRGRVVTARDYLMDSMFQRGGRWHRIYNLCRSYRYQSAGYYVSLLASARGHRPMPDITTIQDLKGSAFMRMLSDELDDDIQKSLHGIQSDRFVLSIYFGANLAKRHTRLARAIFNLLPAPLLRAEFTRRKRWQLVSLRAIALDDVPPGHLDFLHTAMIAHFGRRQNSTRAGASGAFSLAILVDPEEASPPSDPRAIRQFIKAGKRNGFDVDTVERDDFGRLAEFDALFIRATTNVNHFTYRFARRAELEGLAVIDDPLSIVRCTNKVYLSELAQRLQLPTPKTMLIYRANTEQVATELGFPCVLKEPDSAFSAGVVKVDSEEELQAALKRMLSASEIVVGQAFVPTAFDWRVGVLAGKPLYACRYGMAHNHWQIYQRKGKRVISGNSVTVGVERVPSHVLDVSVAAASAIGQGLYGVDVKENEEGGCFLIEVNDNPSIDRGIEDELLGDELYDRIIGELYTLVTDRKRGVGND